MPFQYLGLIFLLQFHLNPVGASSESYVIMTNVKVQGIDYHLFTYDRYTCFHVFPVFKEGARSSSRKTWDPTKNIVSELIKLEKKINEGNSVLILRGANLQVFEEVERQLNESSLRYFPTNPKVMTPADEIERKWVTINYAFKVFDSKDAPTYALVEERGNKMRIVYEARTSQKVYTQLEVAGVSYNLASLEKNLVPVESWNGLVRENLVTTSTQNPESPVADPGSRENFTVMDKDYVFTGTGNFSLCLDMIMMLSSSEGFIPDPFFTYDVRFLLFGQVTKMGLSLGLAKEGENFDHRSVEHKLEGFCHKTLDEVKRLPLPNGPPQRACLAVARFAYYYGYLIGGVTNCKGIYLYSDDMLINNYTTGWELGGVLLQFKNFNDTNLCLPDMSRKVSRSSVVGIYVVLLLVCLLLSNSVYSPARQSPTTPSMKDQTATR